MYCPRTLVNLLMGGFAPMAVWGLLQFLGSVKTPRFITRIMTDPFSMEG